MPERDGVGPTFAAVRSGVSRRVADVLGRRGATAEPDCRCSPAVDGDRLVVDAGDCPGAGDLAAAPACRATVIRALEDRPVDAVLVRVDGLERAYVDDAAAALVAAGRFAGRVRPRDPWLAERCRRDPLAAAREAGDRAGPVGDLVASTGLADVADGAGAYERLLRAYVAPGLTRSRVAPEPPAEATLVERRTLPTDAVVRVYDVGTGGPRRYHLRPVELTFDREETRLLERARRRLARGQVPGGGRVPSRAVRAVAGPGAPVERFAAVLRKHARGLGVVEDCLADKRVADVYATAPVADNPLHVEVDAEPMRTNVRLTERGARALASRFRRESGRAFSTASPTLDAIVDAGDRGTVRVAGVTAPASDGVAFAIRAGDPWAWTLARLVGNDTVTPAAAGLLSVATRSGADVLVAGSRGAGKTTTLAALLWELPVATRTVVIEDTRELPVAALQADGRDVQGIRTAAGEEAGLPPVEALRAALRLGGGAIVLGEVRGEEAAVLYEAMRIGASSHAVMGTIHGDGPAAVRERVVEDLGVPPSSFAATDLLVTLDRAGTGGARRVASITEVVAGDAGPTFEALFERDAGRLTATGRIDRGRSRLLDGVAGPAETYADVRRAVDERGTALGRLAAADLARPDDPDGVAPV